jgi:hypothetical protein
MKVKYNAKADTIFVSTDNNYYPNGQNISDRVDERHIGGWDRCRFGGN